HPVGTFTAPCTVMDTAPKGDITAVKCADATLDARADGDDIVVASAGKELTRFRPLRIRISPFYDRTELVETTLHTVFHNLAEGALLVSGVLFIFLLSLRASLV